MKHSVGKYRIPLLCAVLSLACVLGALSGAAVMSAAAEETCVSSPYTVDFSTYDSVDQCTGRYDLSVSLEDGAMRLTFSDDGSGRSGDPYFSLPLPTGVESSTYRYLAMLVKTDKSDSFGCFRFQTTETGGHYPAHYVNYAGTGEWELVIVDLADEGSILFIDKSLLPVHGTYTNIRLDPFEQGCATDTDFSIKAYALYDSYEAAETFIHYETPAEETEPARTEGMNPADYWRGEDFLTAPLPQRMRWVSYGFRDTSTIDHFLRQGFGGIVSNVNFNRQYLKDEAEFTLLASVYDYAHSLGMSTWIYDEYQWPSGKAYGQVLEGHDELEAMGIEHRTLTGSGGTASYTISGNELKLMCATLTDEGGTADVAVSSDGRSVSANATGSWTLDVYVLRLTYEGTENPADFTTLRHVDLLDPATTQRFIELTYVRYRDLMGDSFAGVEAFFTDEPQLGNRDLENYAVWTDGLEETFKETYGYELSIPAIFSGNDDESRMMRMHYYQLVADLFRTSYTEALAAWCEANGTAASGHMLFEENMNDQVETYGGDFLQLVGALTIPGLDVLHTKPEQLLSLSNVGSFMGIRYVASAAKNAGKDDVMVEYNPGASSDWMPQGDSKMPQSLGGLGLIRLLGGTEYNVINPSADYDSEEYEVLNTYIGRLNTLLEGMNESGEVAVFYPIATVQALHSADDVHSSTYGQGTAAVKLDTNYQNLCLGLLRNQHVFTVLDDESLCAATIEGGKLKVGLGAYRTVILGYAQYISVEALEKLVAFTEVGGTVIFVGDKPTHGLGTDDDAKIAELMARLDGCGYYKRPSKDFYVQVADSVTRAMILTDMSGAAASNILMGEFTGNGKDLTFILNAADSDGTLTLSYADGYAGAYTLYYAEDGFMESGTVGEGETLTVSLPGNMSVLIVRDDYEAPADTAEETTAPVEPATDTSVPSADESTAADEPSEDTAEPTETTTASESGCRSALTAGAGMLVLLAAAFGTAVIRNKRKESM